MAKEKLSTVEVARLSGVHRSTVSRWCSGATVPTQSKQEKLAEMFKVPYDEFIRWSVL